MNLKLSQQVRNADKEDTDERATLTHEREVLAGALIISSEAVAAEFFLA